MRRIKVEQVRVRLHGDLAIRLPLQHRGGLVQAVVLQEREHRGVEVHGYVAGA